MGLFSGLFKKSLRHRPKSTSRKYKPKHKSKSRKTRKSKPHKSKPHVLHVSKHPRIRIAKRPSKSRKSKGRKAINKKSTEALYAMIQSLQRVQQQNQQQQYEQLKHQGLPLVLLPNLKPPKIGKAAKILPNLKLHQKQGIDNLRGAGKLRSKVVKMAKSQEFKGVTNIRVLVRPVIKTHRKMIFLQGTQGTATISKLVGNLPLR